MLYWIAIGMTIAGNLAYNLCAKMTAPVHPLAALTVSYAASLVSCLIAYPLVADGVGLFTAIKGVNAASVILGVAIVMLESGFILAYRAGWSLSQAALFSNVAMTLLLIPISIFAFHESISLVKGVGMVLALAGLVLMSF